jgi:hypothetical protein
MSPKLKQLYLLFLKGKDYWNRVESGCQSTSKDKQSYKSSATEKLGLISAKS